MRQLVDQDQRRLARERAVEIEFMQRAFAVGDRLARQHLEVGQQRLGLGAAVRLDHADHHVQTLRAQHAGRRQHRVGLADAGGGAEEDLQLAPLRLRLFLLQTRQQLIGVGPVVGHEGGTEAYAWRAPATTPSSSTSALIAPSAKGARNRRPVRPSRGRTPRP